ncbi:MAG TPA: hypothetical protein VNV66_04050 [Pilimelia sp.]|nr:hypothetical protein [Pilimelia sp.]
MRQRWLPVGVLALVLFVINVVARLVTRWRYPDDARAQDWITVLMLAAVGLVALGVAAWWARRYPTGRWTLDLALAALTGLLLAVFVGPFISGTTPFAFGAGVFFKQIWQWAGFVGVGALVGFLVVTAFGLDYRSESLRRFAQSRLARPRRVVRR